MKLVRIWKTKLYQTFVVHLECCFTCAIMHVEEQSFLHNRAKEDLSNKKRDKRFETWNVGSLYRAGSLTAATRELARLNLVGVQIRSNKGGTVRVGCYNFFYGKGNENHQLGTGFCFYTTE